MHKLNTADRQSPAHHLNGKFDAQIGALLEKHYTKDREWKYNAETRELRSL